MKTFAKCLEHNNPKTNICFPLVTGNGPQLETLAGNEYLETLRPSINAIAVAHCPSNLRPKYPRRGTGVEKLFSDTKQIAAHQELRSFQSGSNPQVYFSPPRSVGLLVSKTHKTLIKQGKNFKQLRYL